MNVTLREVLAGAEQHAVPLTAECVGYLVLGAADQVLGAPRSVGTEDLLLSEDGAVRVAGGRAARADEAERDLRAVLDALLMPASSASAGLLRASRRPPGTGIEGLVRELETALIPVNRSAAKRALSRLQRETRRALDSGRIRFDTSAPPPAPSAHAEPSAARAPENVAVQPLLAVAALPSPAPELPHSEPLPSVALPPVATELAPAVSAVAPVSEVAVMESAIVPVVALIEQREHTELLSKVAPREPVAPLAAQLVETRPEPVVLRASQRPAPPAPPTSSEPETAERGHTVPLPPVVRVESAPPPPVARVESAPPPPVARVEAVPESATRDTPVLGTRVDAEPIAVFADSVHEVEAASVAELAAASMPELAAASVAEVLAESIEESELDISVIVEARPEVAPAPVVEAAATEDDDGLIEVIFEDEEHTVFPEDHELIAESAMVEASDTTDPCPPPAAESMLPPPCEVVTAAPPVATELPPVTELPEVTDAETPAPATLDAETIRPAPPEPPAVEPPAVELLAVEVVAAEPPASEPPVAESAPVEPAPSDVELAALVESALPPWTTAEVPAFEVTPPPRVALPTPRRSDVEALLGRMNDEPLGVDELRSGLKHLAGLDLTPPPTGPERGE